MGRKGGDSRASSSDGSTTIGLGRRVAHTLDVPAFGMDGLTGTEGGGEGEGGGESAGEEGRDSS